MKDFLKAIRTPRVIGTQFKDGRVRFMLSDGMNFSGEFVSRPEMEGETAFVWPATMQKCVVRCFTPEYAEAISAHLTSIWEEIHQAEQDRYQEEHDAETTRIMAFLSQLQQDVMTPRLRAIERLKTFLQGIQADWRLGEFMPLL